MKVFRAAADFPLDLAQAHINIKKTSPFMKSESFDDWGRWGYDDSVGGEVTKTTLSGDWTT